MKYGLGISVTFEFDAEIEFDGTKEEFAALSREDRERLAYSVAQETWDSNENIDTRFKAAQDWGVTVVTELTDSEDSVELD